MIGGPVFLILDPLRRPCRRESDSLESLMAPLIFKIMASETNHPEPALAAT